GNQYKVRLLTGADHNPTQLTPSTGYFLEGSHNSEWSRLFYPIIIDDSYLNEGYAGYKDPRYTMSQLQMNSDPYSWCQETHQLGPTLRVVRGSISSSMLTINTSPTTAISRGWRPCLELVV